MKKAILLFHLFVALPLLVCGRTHASTSTDTDAPPRFTMEATLTELSDRLTVEVTKSAYTSGTHLVIVNESTVIQEASGQRIMPTDLKVGDRLSILYNGQVMLSYPPQIVALSITVN